MRILALALLLSLQAEKVSFDDKVLATIPEGVQAKDITFFKDGRQVAYRAMAAGGQYVCVNNIKQQQYQVIIEGLKWSNSGKLSYRVSNGGSTFAVVSGQP